MTLARWFVQPRSLMAALGSSVRTDHFIVVDDSFSMTTRRQTGEVAAAGTADALADTPDGTTNTIFENARTAALDIVRHIRRVAPEDSVTVLLSSRPDEPVRTAPAVGQVPESTWTEDIPGLQPCFRAGNMPAVFKAVRDRLDANNATLRAAVYVVSDFQTVDWLSHDRREPGNGPGEPARPRAGGPPGGGPPGSPVNTGTSPAAVLESWGGRDRDLELLLVDVGRKVESNLCVAGIQPEQAQSVAGVVGRYTVRIVNFGDEPARAGQMQVFMGETALPPVPVPEIGPDQSVTVPVEVAFGQEGSQRLGVELGPDTLPADNARSCAVPVERALRILLVNGEPSPDPQQDESFLLKVALRPEGPEFSGNETTVINENELEVADLSEYHAVVLLNVGRVTEDMADRLKQYAAGGGGVIFFLGDQVEAAAYNRLLYRGGNGLLPAMLGDPVSVPSRQPGYGLGDVSADDPAVGQLARAGPAMLSNVFVWQWFNCELPSATASASRSEPGAVSPVSPSEPGSVSPVPSGHRPASSTAPADRAAAHVLLRMNDPDKSAYLIERTFGRGHVLLFTTTADKEWNNLPDQPVFVVMTMELMQHVARPAQDGRDYLVGEPIRVAVDPARFDLAALLKLPTFPSTPAIRVAARPEPDAGQSIFEWTDTSRPGLYQFDLRKTDGDAATRQMAVNLDTRESNLRRADRQALLASMGRLKAAYVTGDSLSEHTQTEARQELWPVLLGLLVFVLMLEQGLAWWFGANRNWHRAFQRVPA
jgi:hypothetical protein